MKEKLKAKVDKVKSEILPEFIIDKDTELDLLRKKVVLYENQVAEFNKKYFDREVEFQKKINDHIYANEAFVGIISELKKYSAFVQTAQEVINELEKSNDDLTGVILAKNEKLKELGYVEEEKKEDAVN